jgi:hypothetical protein
VEDDGELSCQGHFSFFHPSPLGKLAAQLFSDEPFTGRVKMM